MDFNDPKKRGLWTLMLELLKIGPVLFLNLNDLEHEDQTLLRAE
jgi:hypothetical protein